MTRRRRIFLSPPWVGEEERAAVSAAFDSGYVAPCGPMVDAFERAIAAAAGRKHAVALSGGTAALDLLMAEYGVDATWTVIAPALTFIATVGPAAHRGAKIVFVDSDATGNVDVVRLEQALADATRRRRGTASPHVMFIGVDLYGRCCDYDAVDGLCRRYGAVYINDSAEAVGATYHTRPAGSAGVAAVYSFNGNKIVTTSGGGAIVTDDADLAARARKRSQQSREPFPWYQHEEVGYNYRMSNLLAAVGLAQLEKLPVILEKRRRILAGYRKALAADSRYTFLTTTADGSNGWLTVVLTKGRAHRDRLLARFAAADIEARPVWKPLHLQPVFRNCRVYGGKVAETLFARGLCLPSGTGMSRRDLARVTREMA
ncbi:MAG: DegT/DnrJ/EryC1/StrS family aminotransferase [Kiritimatiellia bacterium]